MTVHYLSVEGFIGLADLMTDLGLPTHDERGEQFIDDEGFQYLDFRGERFQVKREQRVLPSRGADHLRVQRLPSPA